MIKGITVTLHEKTKVGEDEFHKSIYTTEAVEVENVLVTPTSDTENVSAQDLYGAKAQYTLCIPKGDTHKWENSQIDFYGKAFRSFGVTTEYIEANTPGNWNKKVLVAVYE